MAPVSEKGCLNFLHKQGVWSYYPLAEGDFSGDKGRVSSSVSAGARSGHSMLTREVRPDSGSEGRLTRAGHGFPEFNSTRSTSGFVGNHGGRTLPKEGLVWSATWGMSV